MADTDDAPVKKSRIRYALTNAGGGPTYYSSVTRPGARTPWGDSEDNPASPNFVPPTERGAIGQARFWAMQSRRNRGENAAGEFDPKPKEN